METSNNTPTDMPPLPPKPAPTPAVSPCTPEDPTWWRAGSVPFIVLLLVAAAADLAWPREAGWGIGAGLGCLFACAALLLLRRDFSKGECLFLGVLAVINFLALVVSGNIFNWCCNMVLPFIMVMLPQQQQPLRPGQRFRNWWSFWTSTRLKSAADGAKPRLRELRNLLPLIICIIVGASLFIAFLTIFATGNPVVEAVREWVVETWNSLVAYLHLSWDFLLHMLYWFVGIVWFGIYTFRRPDAAPSAPCPRPGPTGHTLLPHLPIYSLIGIDLAFLIATSTDIAYLWFGRVPAGISQTAYLHNGAVSITWASVLAAGILIYLFRSAGGARRSVACRAAGYLLVLQTFLLAVSVCMRLYYQIADFGFTARRIQAVEALLLGTSGLAVLLCYMIGSGVFRKYAKAFLGSMLLLLVAFSIYSPARLAGDLNMLYAPAHPQWSFSYADFGYGRFDVEENLDFACYVQQIAPNAKLAQDIRKAAAAVERRAAQASWINWNINLSRDAAAAARILYR